MVKRRPQLPTHTAATRQSNAVQETPLDFHPERKMLVKQHNNLLSWLMAEDYDVWLYLYENYLIHVMNHKKMHPQIQRTPQFKKMLKNLRRESAWKQNTESRCYANYVGGKYSIAVGEAGPRIQGSIESYYPTHYWLAGERILSKSKKDRGLWSGDPMDAKMVLGDDLTKDKIIEICRFNELDYRKSWPKKRLLDLVLKYKDN
jgi:hypothetical protein